MNRIFSIHTLNRLFLIICCFAFIFQVYGIIQEWIHPSQTATQVSEKNIKGIDFPVIFKICPDPAFVLGLLRKEGYRDVFSYFRGESKFNKSIYGWAGHTNTRLITMRSKPDYVEADLSQLLLMLLLWFLLLQLFIKGQLWSIKNYLIHIKAITVVALASRPCLDLSLTLLLP